MRFSRLHLEAYGPFTDREILLPHNEHDLHLIIGPNEAGKSSLLRALSALLFGIETRTPDDFLHPYDKLRIGATLEDEAQNALRIRRKKGRKQTLRDADDQPIDEQRLSSLLGPVDKPLFEQLFGLDLERLQQGGAELLRGEGDVGKALYEAGSGLTGLNHLLAGMQRELDALYRPRASKGSSLNLALKNYQSLRKQAQQESLSTSQWRSNEREYNAYQERTNALSQEQRELEAELKRIERIERNRRGFTQIDTVQTQLDTLGPQPELPPDASEKRVRVEQALHLVEQRYTALTREQEGLTAHLAKLTPRAEVLQRTTLIEQLNKGFGSYRDSQNDLPDIERRLHTMRDQCAALLDSLAVQCSTNPAAIATHLPPESLRRALTEHLTARRETLAVLRSLKPDIERRAQTILSHQQRLAEQAPSDPNPLLAQVNRIRALGPLEQRLAEQRQQLTGQQRRLDERLRRELHWEADPATLRQTPAPERESVLVLQHKWEDAQSEQARLKHQLEQINSDLERIDEKLVNLAQRGTPPTQEAWMELRNERDTALQELLTEWQQGKGCDPTAISLFARLLERSDHYAEQLLESADASASFAELQRTHIQAQQQRTKIEAELQQQDKLRQQLRTQWLALLQPLHPHLHESFRPDMPVAILEWLELRTICLNESDSLADAALACDTQQGRISELADELRHSLEAQGQRPASQTLDTLLVQAERLAEQLTDLQQQRREQQLSLQQLEQEQREKRAEVDRIVQQIDRDKELWQTQLNAIGLSPDSGLDSVAAQLERWQQLASRNAEMHELTQRVEGMQRRINNYQQELAELAVAIGIDPSQPVDQCIGACRAALDQAISEQQRKQTLMQQLSENKQAIVEARQQLNEQTQVLALLCQRAGVSQADQLPQVEKSSARAMALKGELAQAQQRMLADNPDLSLVQLREELLAQPVESASDYRLTLESRLESNRAALKADSERLGELRHIRQSMDGSAAAAGSEAEAAQWLAEARLHAERYVRLRLGQFLLQRTIESYREENQTPLLARAGEHFAHLTGESFSQLVTDFDDSEREQLMAQRPSGERLTVGQMSLGTIDQLYLALRLAAIERHLERHPAVPVVLDDILVQFDDQRTGTALDLLAALSRRTQVIYFTHHPHLAQLARERLGGIDVIEHDLSRTPHNR